MEYQKLYDKAVKAGELENMTPTYLKFNKKGDVIIGMLKAIAGVDSSLGEGGYNQYVVETDDGLVKFRLGQAADKELAGSLIVGDIYRFEYLGKDEISGGRSVNKVTVGKIMSPSSKVGGDKDVPF